MIGIIPFVFWSPSPVLPPSSSRYVESRLEESKLFDRNINEKGDKHLHVNIDGKVKLFVFGS